MQKSPQSTDGENPRSSPEETGFYAAYASFSTNLRIWLLAYGVGLPVLFIQSEAAWSALRSNVEVRSLAYLFLTGIALQVASALMYKSAMWYLYAAELKDLPETTRRFKVSHWISDAYWLEFLIDLATIAVFAYATVRSLNAVI